MDSKTVEIKLTISEDELQIIKECLSVRAHDLSHELDSCVSGDSEEEIEQAMKLIGKIAAAQNARCKLDHVKACR